MPYKDFKDESLSGDHNYDRIEYLESNDKSYDLVSADVGKMVLNASIEDIKGQIDSILEKVNEGENKWKCSLFGKASKDKQLQGFS